MDIRNKEEVINLGLLLSKTALDKIIKQLNEQGYKKLKAVVFKLHFMMKTILL